MIWQALLGALLAGLAFYAFQLALERRELRRLLLQERDTCKAAQWLARYNYGFWAALQDVVMTETGMPYAKLQTQVRKRLATASTYGNLGQLIPLNLIPAELKEAAKIFNRRMTSGWVLPYSAVLGDDPQEARVLQLQDALVAAQYETLLADSDYVTALARSAGASFDAAEALLLAARQAAKARVDRILAIDKEEVLPSIY